MNTIKTITIKKKEYEAAIDGSDILLESLESRIVIPGAGKKLEDQADNAYWATRRRLSDEDYRAFIEYSQEAWINEYIDEKFVEFVMNNLSLGVTETFNLN